MSFNLPTECVNIPRQRDNIPKTINKEFNKSGSKYLREILLIDEKYVDVYAVLDAFNVISPPIQHAIKKLLCAGIRGKGDELQDLTEAKDAMSRAIEMYRQKNK